MSDNVKVEWTVKHTLTEQDFRKLILEKLKRAELLAQENRKLKELA